MKLVVVFSERAAMALTCAADYYHLEVKPGSFMMVR